MSALTSWIGRAIGLTGANNGEFWRTFFGSSTYANKTVTPDSALQLATVWACVRLLSETVATLPIGVYERLPNGGRRSASDHPLYEVLHDSPNADFTAAEFWEGVVVCLCLWGNFYAEHARSTRRLTALTMLRPDRMSVERDDNGALIYRYRDEDATRVYQQNEIFHVRGFGAGLDVGLSPISYARQSLASAMATDESAAKLFANGLQTSGVLTTDAALKPEQRTQLEAVMAKYIGSPNAQKMMILESGLKWQAVPMNPEDAQMLQTRTFQVEEICRWFRVPPWMVGSTEKSTSWGTGLEQQMIAFLTFSLRPYLTRIEQAVRRQLIIGADKRRFYAEFSLEGLLRADSAGRAELYSKLSQHGILNRNEIRELENREPFDGGDVHTVPANLLPINMLGKVAQLPREEPLNP